MSALATGIELAELAARTAEDGSSELQRELSRLKSWDAVVRCALDAGAIPKQRADQFELIDFTGSFSGFVSPRDPRIRTPNEMRGVPAGAFIAFIEVDPPDAYHRFVHDPRGRRHLIHAMISLGDGLAAGNRNSCIGVGSREGWEILNLADDLNWIPAEPTERTFSGINAVALGINKSRPLRIRYRELEKQQVVDPGSAAGVLVAAGDPGGPGDPGEPGGPGADDADGIVLRNLGTGDHTRVVAGEIWDVGPLADCVALAAVFPAHSLPTENAQTVFLWHVNGGLIREDMPAYQALRELLENRGNADWIVVHGTLPGPEGRRQFMAQDSFVNLVDGFNSLQGHITRQYRGGRLLIDFRGRIRNAAELVELGQF